LTPEQLSEAIVNALRSLAQSGVLEEALVPSEVVVERPKNRDHGDWATNVAMQLAGKLGINPRELAQQLASELEGTSGVESLSIAGPGFINFFVSDAAAGALAKVIVEQGAAYGLSQELAGQRLNLEFVSANPTGPIHLGGTRWAAVGDSLARILISQGAVVEREYYFNDHGAQIDRFARSLVAAALGQPAGEDGYSGEYITEISQRILAEQPEVLELSGQDQQEAFRKAGVEMMFTQIKKSLEDFGVHFDVFFHENSLYESGAVEKSIARLRELGHIFEEDGAIWLRSSTFGDDRDRVVIKSDGEAANQMEILIGQLVSLVKDGQPVRMSKRAGNVVTMEDLVEAVGVDAARYALTRSSINSTLDIDIELLARRTNDNPVFYVQYAHARTRQVDRNAPTLDVDKSEFDPSLLSEPSESELLAKLAEFPRVVSQAAEFREPHRVARYLEEVAGSYHRFYDSCRILPLPARQVETVHRTRLWLNDAAGVVLANGLALLGVSAPERM